MTARLINGRILSKTILNDLKTEIEELGITPVLSVILVGNNPASKIYVASKEKAAESAGIKTVTHVLPENTPEAEVSDLIETLNQDTNIHGILVQMPLPVHMNTAYLLNKVLPCKDVDGLHIENIGKLASGEKGGMTPCTPQGCLLLLQSEMTPSDMRGKHAVIVGCSNLVGRPIAQLLLRSDCTVTIAHSKTVNLPEICAQADILVVATGCPKLIKGAWLKSGVIVIDVGISRMEDGSLSGDVNFDEAKEVAAAITPVPGGVGPMTIACLMKNTLKAAL